MKNIVLIGMPAAGKSTAGVILAKTVGYAFVDTDLLIQSGTGKLLKEIIDERGPEGFIQTENEIISRLEAESSVIATGGSAVYGAEAMARLKADGVVVYLRLPFEDLTERLGNIRNRGVVLREGQTLRGLFAERSALYERYADIVIDEHGRDIEETVRLIREACAGITGCP